MTHAIKQIVDTDGEPMMEVVVHSDCSAVDMEAIHAEALEMNKGIELALLIIAAMGGNESAGDAAGGCLYRDGFNEINYLVSVALSLYAGKEEAHAEALEMDSTRNLKSPHKFAPVKHFGAYQVIQNQNRVISTCRVAVLGSIEAARDHACEIRDVCEEDSPDDHFHVRYVPFYLFAGAPFRPVIM